MAVDNFIYQGINRAVSDFSGAKLCEELINLRPTEGGLVPVRPFSVLLADTVYLRIYPHHTTAGKKYFGVKTVETGVQVWQIEIVDGEAVEVGTSPLISIAGLTADEKDDVIANLHYASAGNVVLFSICATDSGVLENYAFIWKADGYEEMEAKIPSVTYGWGGGEELVTAKDNPPAISQSSTAEEVVSAVGSAVNAIVENNPDLCFGPIIIATAFRTTDGSTFWSGNWKVYDPTGKINSESQLYRDSNNCPAEYNGFMDEYGHAYSFLVDSQSQMDGVRVTLTFPAVSGWNEDTSVIQSVEVYCSKPVTYVDATKGYEGWKGILIYLPQVPYDEMDLGGQLLYHQASIPLASLAESSQTVRLNFGGNVQMTEDTLDADAGAVRRYGEILSYNARLHYYRSVSKTDVGKASFLQPGSGDIVSTKVIFRYEDAEKSGLYLSEAAASLYDEDAYAVTAPSINVKEVITYAKTGTTTYTVRKYRMTASPAYNYAICVGDPYYSQNGLAAISEYADLVTSTITGYETASINVTEQYNPFVFRVEHSYLAPGNIVDVQPQMAGLTDTSYGRDPLSVFTEKGVYALTQGSADVLYGAFLPVSDLTAYKGGGVPVEMGTFFLADGSLWLLSGRRVTLISDALSEGPHKYIRSCEGYQKLSGPDMEYTPSTTVTDPVYDVSSSLSQVRFEEFVRTGGRLAYNRFRMELFVSNPAYPYTYVLSLKYRQWFKLSYRLWQDEKASVVANAPSAQAGKMNVLDLATEETGTILAHMQGRPFSMAYQYAHVHRIVAMVRATLSQTESQVAAVGLYGSDDLQDWKLLAYAKRNGGTGPLRISQMRTPPASRSWRYYTVCFGGLIPTDTDLGPLLIDYKPVIRRIG